MPSQLAALSTRHTHAGNQVILVALLTGIAQVTVLRPIADPGAEDPSAEDRSTLVAITVRGAHPQKGKS